MANLSPYRSQFLLKSCPNLRIGQSVHADVAKRGFDSNPFVRAEVVSLYSGHGSQRDVRQLLDEMTEPNAVIWNVAISRFFHAGDCNGAREIFDWIPSPNGVTWSAMIAGYAQNGRPRDSLLSFRRMRREESCAVVNPNIIAGVLSACAQLKDLGFGEQVHGCAVKIGTYTESDAFVGAALVNMYGRCGSMGLSRLAFDSVVSKSVVAWSSLVANYVRINNFPVAMEVFKEMIRSGAVPNNVTLTTMISACSGISCLFYGRELHAAVVRRRAEKPDIFVSTALIDMYCKCGSMSYACRVFQIDGSLLGCCPTPMWNAMISGCVTNNHLDDAFCLVRSLGRSLRSGAWLNSVTMAAILPACGKSLSLLYGKELHCYTLKYGLDKEVVVGNGLLDMYCKCGKVSSAKNQFDMMIEKNTISWTTLIDGYGAQGDGHGAIEVFEIMVREEKVEPDHVTFVALISACSHSGLVEEGLRYFELMTREYGITPTGENYGCLVDLLARAGHINEAMNVIRTMPIEPSSNVWGALLGACRIHGNVDGAELAMQHLLELEPERSGFQKLLSNIYAQVGRLDSAQNVCKETIALGVATRLGCSWLDKPSRFNEKKKRHGKQIHCSTA
ncbi:pentatricopeptide repeat-containing protein At2g13600-like [Phoenix dactylifera]|uniref:Pentatricopeptide repeat-containing protein At2g13600-like n=1 Tax=Phoenix dactylifera TaxID=42345 RepID=A0A8B7D5A7_PHODC|nr:pentatricopeptide repeat-containing protein At2g13600-like [Phoenix dactylifera]